MWRSLCHSVGGPRHAAGLYMRRVFFWDLAAGFAKKKTRKCQYFEILTRQIQTDYAGIFS